MSTSTVIDLQNEMFQYINSIPEDKKIKQLLCVNYDGRSMDFDGMINNKDYDNSIFIFNDNYTEHKTSKTGRGNAKIRKYNNYSGLNIPRSFGIPTGHYRTGYKSLDESIVHINECMYELINIILRCNYQRLVYSVDSLTNILIGTSIFNVSDDVKRYISKCFLILSANGILNFVNSTGKTYDHKITYDNINTFK